ncbi:MAG: NAD(P)-dependent oxidoreductase [Sedimentisphaerales bacterium]
MSKIVVLDDVYLTKNHIEKLQKLGDVRIFKDNPSSEEETLQRLGDTEIAIVGWTNITETIIQKLPKLRMISVWATGYDYIDLKAATKNGIVVTNVPAYASESVAEHVFALILSVIRQIPQADKHVREGGYDWKQFQGIELAGKVLGVIGTGAIGRRVAEIGKCLGMKVIAVTAHPSKERAQKLGVKYVDFDTLLRESDVISVNVPLTSETDRLFNEEAFDKMKHSAIFVNTSRGKVVDESALYKALANGKLGGAGLDVLIGPIDKHHPLFQLSNVVFTPHTGFYTNEALCRCTDICLENVECFLKASPRNVVNPGVLGRAGS